jgi:hypothetical protein
MWFARIGRMSRRSSEKSTQFFKYKISISKGEVKNMRISDRVQAMQNSPIRKFNPMADAAEAAGVKIYHLNIGQPDIETPSVFWEAEGTGLRWFLGSARAAGRYR